MRSMHENRLEQHARVAAPYGLPHPGILLLLAMAVLGVTLACNAGAAESVPTLQRTAQLTHLVRHDCGSCHGLTLNGGLGPPLLPAALAGKPADYLKHVILNGATGTAMPGWAPLLSAADAEWIAENLLRGLPDAR
jgi:cytochrome c55X